MSEILGKIESIESFSRFFNQQEGFHKDGFPKKALEEIYRSKLFKCFLPPSLGGLGMNMAETLEVIDTCSYIDGSFGWLIQIGNGGNYFASLFDKETSMELFSPANAVLAGSGTATGIARKVDGGYGISGAWKYCSGADHATFFTVTCAAEEENANISCVVMPGDVEVIRDWDTIGLSNTSTHSIRVKNAFVPGRFLLRYDQQKQELPSDVFKFPFLSFAQLFFIRVQTGIFRRLLDEAERILAECREKWADSFPERVQHIERHILAGRNMLKRIVALLEMYVSIIPHGEEEEKKNLSEKLDADVKKWNDEMRNPMHELFRMSGMSVLYANHPFTRAYLDLVCASQHSLLNKYQKLTV